ncbi:MAG: hypothetical protein K0R29_1016 [Pseudobdellovibrio sp.]|jgi:hypothetical protein|nr:hypothetical protein [Pseudobdellovibrio sp.]
MDEKKPKPADNQSSGNENANTPVDNSGYTKEELDFIKKIREQISLEDEDSAILIASYTKNIP